MWFNYSLRLGLPAIPEPQQVSIQSSVASTLCSTCGLLPDQKFFTGLGFQAFAPDPQPRACPGPYISLECACLPLAFPESWLSVITHAHQVSPGQNGTTPAVRWCQASVGRRVHLINFSLQCFHAKSALRLWSWHYAGRQKGFAPSFPARTLLCGGNSAALVQSKNQATSKLLPRGVASREESLMQVVPM